MEVMCRRFVPLIPQSLLILSISILTVVFLAGARVEAGQSNSPSARAGEAPTSPPVAPIRPVTDDCFGMKVVDPYRYMENLKDPKVDAWFKGQNAYTRAALAKIPGRDALLARIKEPAR